MNCLDGERGHRRPASLECRQADSIEGLEISFHLSAIFLDTFALFITLSARETTFLEQNFPLNYILAAPGAGIMRPLWEDELRF